MSRITATFERCRNQGRKALVTFVTAGDAQPEHTVPLMHTLVEAGADVLELGVPFSDPMADGPVIQAANERALAHDVSMRDVLGMVREFRERDQNTPVVLMGYLNPIEVMGYERFAEEAAAAGVDGTIIVDLPPEEGEVLNAALETRGLDLILLIAPTTTSARIESICQVARGFVYYVSLAGVTGASTLDTDAVAAKVADIRKVTALPVGVGFGISDAESAGRVARVADAAVVGSAIVKLVGEHRDDPVLMRERIAALIGGMRRAMDQTVAATA